MPVRKEGVTRRTVLKGAVAAGGLLAAGGLGYRVVANLSGREYELERTRALLAGITPSTAPGELPNIIVIVADDLGYGDLSCYGSQSIHTPNLDRMAAEGARMTNACATAALCSPSRAGLLTGRYPIRTHVAMPLYPAAAPMDIIFNAGGVYPYGVRGIPADEILISELLLRQGYRTAMLGKWHLGDRSPHLPNDRGFEHFYGALYSNDMEPYAIYRDKGVELEPPVDQSALTENLTAEALRFIEENRDQPFFLYYAQPFPHIPLHASAAFRGRSKAGLYGDTVEELDWSVGEIQRTLETLGLDDKTLVIFTSDNGPWWQGNPGLTRGRKNLPFEGGFRVPLIARWPGTIPDGIVSDALSMNFDIYATCLAVAGVPLPGDRAIDGKSLVPALSGDSESLHESLYYYKGSRLIGMRHGNWKYLRRHMTDNGGYASLSQGPFLFDLGRDPNESYNLIESEPATAAMLVRMMDDWESGLDNLRGWLP